MLFAIAFHADLVIYVGKQIGIKYRAANLSLSK